jgi:glycosyltransferase involved in cell wall biosynthesis
MKILFVSHASNRSGAPLVLLELLRFIRRETAHESTILSLRSGPLEADFARVAVPFVPARPFVAVSKLGAARRRVREMEVPAVAARLLQISERLIERRARSIARRRSGQFDLIYVNSAASGDAVRALQPLARDVPIVVHVHELQSALEMSGDAWKWLKRHGDFFIAASDATRNYLVDEERIAPDKVETVYEWVDLAPLETDKAAARSELRARLNLESDAFLVGGCGTMEWRKGADLWAAVAAQSDARVQFVWLGGARNAFRRGVEFDLKRTGAHNRVRFLEETAKPATFFAALDAFALTSREDPFPLVAIEAAAQGVPVVCFQGAGGAPELVDQRAGVCVRYGDVWGMARALDSLRRDQQFREQLGFNAAKRAREMCDVNVNAARVVKRLEELVGN